MGFYWGNLKGGDHVKDLDVGGIIISHTVLTKQDGKACIGVMSLRIETNAVSLLTL
jgi:hypothetical protein